MIVPVLLLTVTLILVALLMRNPFVSAAVQRLIGRFWPNRTIKIDVVQDGEDIRANYAPRPSARPSEPRQRRELPQRSLLLAVLALIIVISIIVLPRSLLAPRDQFLTAVAPFTDQTGVSSTAGMAAARDLVAALTSSGNAAILLNTTPANAAEANERMRQEGADALLTGSITDGGLLDQPSLTPLLFYQPSGAYAPNGWDGYRGRFTMPQAYTLSAQPLNGKVVLPLLMRALGRYNSGDFDGAFGDFGTLITDYPELAQPLPRALRGNLLWATGNFSAAIDEYQRTGVMSISRSQASEMALLANNLGAIYQDAGSPAAAQAFEQAQALLGNQSLPALQVNRASELLAANQNDAAIAMLEPLRNQNPSTAALALLADAYLNARRFDDADAVMQQAEFQVDEMARQTITPYSQPVAQRLRAKNAEQRARLVLDRAIGTSDNLLWELLTGQALSRDTITAPRAQIADVVKQMTANEADWLRLAAAADVAQQPYRSQIANEQAQRSAATRFEQQKLLAALDLNLARATGTTDQAISGFLSVVSGQRLGGNPTQNGIEALWKQNPNDSEVAVLRGFASLAAGQPEQARQQFEQVNRVAANRPEPVYGLAQIALRDNDRARAKTLLNDAITRDTNFYPARSQLAQLAEEDKEWPTAIAQRRWLVEHRGSTPDKLALAHTLQISGPSGFAAAERELLPLANAQNLDAIVQLSDLYLAADDVPAAQAALERARAAAPKNAQLAYKLGNVLSRLNRGAEARQEYEAAVKLDPSFPQARVELGKIYAANGQIDRAAEQYAAALRSGTSDATALGNIGNVLLIAGEQKQALEAYQRALKNQPNDPSLHLGAARVYLAQGKPNEAAREAEQAVALAGGTNPQAQVTLGDISLALGDSAGAKGHFTQASQQDPKLATAVIGLGRATAASNDWAVAATYFNQAISIDPQAAEAYYWKGEALLQEKQIEEARNAYANALTLRANYPEAQYGLAKAQAAAGRLADAHGAVAAALKLRHVYPEAYVLDGLIYEQENQRDAARRAYDQAINSDRTATEAFYRRALLTIGDGNIVDARSDLEAAVRLRDNFAEAHYWLGRSYLADNRLEQANQQFNLALDHSPNRSYPEAQFYEGVARERLGDRANAFIAYRTALEQGKGSPWASEAQAAIARLGQ